MTRRAVVLMIMAALMGGAGVAGCAQLPWIQGNETEVTAGPRPLVLPPGAFTTATEATTTVAAQKAGPYATVDITPMSMPPQTPQAIVPPPAQLPPGPPTAPPKQPLAAAPAGVNGPLPQVIPGSPVAADNQLRGPVRDPLADAAQTVVRGRLDDVGSLLSKYDPATRELLEAVLLLAANVADKKMSPAEISALQKRINDIIQALIPRTELVIDSVCFCEWVKAFGNYQPLPESHVFQAASATRTGERVQLYVELRNFESIKADGGFFETRLASAVEIRDSKDNKTVWSHNFDDKGHAVRSRSQLHDYFNNYSFCLPQLPPGTYTMIIRIVDQTRPDVRREKSKSITFKVGSNQK